MHLRKKTLAVTPFEDSSGSDEFDEPKMEYDAPDLARAR
jgi:hypothetical protein